MVHIVSKKSQFFYNVRVEPTTDQAKSLTIAVVEQML
jgi:hypothetical protein